MELESKSKSKSARRASLIPPLDRHTAFQRSNLTSSTTLLTISNDPITCVTLSSRETMRKSCQSCYDDIQAPKGGIRRETPHDLGPTSSHSAKKKTEGCVQKIKILRDAADEMGMLGSQTMQRAVHRKNIKARHRKT